MDARIDRSMQEPDAITLSAIRAEVIRKNTANSRMRCSNCALQRSGGDGRKVAELRDQVQKEAIQVAAVAVRILEDGTSEFPQYRPPHRQVRDEDQGHP